MTKKQFAAVSIPLIILGGVYLGTRTSAQKPEDSKQANSAPSAEVSTPEHAVNSGSLEKVQAPSQAAEVHKTEISPPVQPGLLEFQETVAHALQIIPTIEELKKLPSEEVHNTPQQIFQAGREIGKVATLIEQYPNLKPQGLQFYETCSNSESYPETIRAICYSSLKELDTAHSIDVQVPQEVRELADMLE